MKLLTELLIAEARDDCGFVIINEGLGSASMARARDIVADAKGLAAKLDDKLEAKFRKELNKRLAAFNIAAAKDNVRAIDAKLAQVEAVYSKYADKV